MKYSGGCRWWCAISRAKTARRVKLELRGQSTEIDKYLIERMMDPVLHLVRNAVSHGIEPPDVRIANGKSPEGTITLSAAAVGDMVTLEVADDGYGVDEEAVVDKARQAGLSVPAGPLDAAAVLALLCSPGFSTKEETDRASGRGVGMAVVKAMVEELSGTMTLDTEAGQGTRFIIQLPVTLAITDALIGRVGAEAFAIPQGSVREVIEIAEADMRQLEENEIVPYRDGALPIIRLSRLFGIASTARTAASTSSSSGTDRAAMGIAVDRIVGQREIVVRTHGGSARARRWRLGRDRPGRRPRRADSRSGGARAAHEPARAARDRLTRPHGDGFARSGR